MKPAKRDPLLDPFGLFVKAERLYRRGGVPRGQSTGWHTLDPLYTVAPGQWTVVTGMPGSGKSEWLDALLVNLAESADWLFAVYSPENYPPETHLAKLCEKRMRKPFNEGKTPRMSEREFGEAALWILDRFLWLDVALKSPEQLIESALLYNVGDRRLGVVLDPWNTLEHQRGGMNETDYVSFVLTQVTNLARDANAHIWLVVHPAKIPRGKDGTRPVPTPYDISGCYSDDTEVLTRRGWLRHSEISTTDEVAGFDPHTGLMVYQRPSRVVRKEYSGPMLRFRGYGYDLLVTPEHRMLLRPYWSAGDSGVGRPVRWPKGEWSFCQAADVPSAHFVLPLAAELRSEREGLMHPLVAALAGWYVAEGSAVGNYGVSLCQAEGEKAQQIDALLASLCIAATRRVNGPGGNGGVQNIVTWYIGATVARDVVDWLRAEAGIGSANKRIPPSVLLGSAEAKRAFLAAYLAGDGSARQHGGWSATTTSRGLVDDLQRLALELGFAVSWNPREWKRAPHHAPSWQVNISQRQVTALTDRNRSFEEYAGVVWCLTVPTGAYFVRRNGRASVCGNSAHWYNKADNIVCVHREQSDEFAQDVEIHVQKIRFKNVGHVGLCTLKYDRVTGRYFAHDGATPVNTITGLPELYVDPERGATPPVFDIEAAREREAMQAGD